MAYRLTLPDSLKNQGWKVKIRDKERAEPPHVSIVKNENTWRWGLREKDFLDKKPPPRKVPKELLDHLQENLKTLETNWDQMYPHNPVISEDDE